MVTRRFGAIVMLVAALLAALPVAPARAADATYIDPQMRFSLLALDGFQPVVAPPFPIVASYTSPQFMGAGYDVEAEDATTDIGPNGMLDDLAPAFLRAVSRLDGYEAGPDSIRPATLGGLDARRYEFFATFAGTRLRLRETYTLIGRTRYSLGVNARDADWAALEPQLRRVEGTFAFLPGAAAPLPVAPVAPAASVPTAFVSMDRSFAFTLPANYRQLSPSEQTPGSSIRLGNPLANFASTDREGTNFNIAALPLPAGTARPDLDSGVAMLRASLPQLSDRFEPGSEPIQVATLGGQPARLYDFYVRGDNERAHGVQVIAIVGNAVATLTFTGREGDYQALRQDAQAVLDSLMFMPS